MDRETLEILLGLLGWYRIPWENHAQPPPRWARDWNLWQGPHHREAVSRGSEDGWMEMTVRG